MDDPDPDPLEQIRIEKKHGIQYEYRVLRDGDKEWKYILPETTRLGTIEEVRTIWGTFFYQRRKYLVTGLDPNGEYSFCVRAFNISGASEEICNLDVITPVSAEATELPATFSLAQNYPNPFNPVTTISYYTPVAGPVRLEVFDMVGRAIATLVDGWRPEGEYSVRFQAKGVSTGTYMYRLTTDTATMSRMLTIAK